MNLLTLIFVLNADRTYIPDPCEEYVEQAYSAELEECTCREMYLMTPTDTPTY